MTSNDDVDAKILNAEDQRRQKIMDKATEIVQIDDSELPQSVKDMFKKTREPETCDS